MRTLPRSLMLALSAVLAIAILAACSSSPAATQNIVMQLPLAPAEKLDTVLGKLPAYGRDAYRLALANEETFKQIPCYCGCGTLHSNVRECFVSSVGTDGAVTWDYHGSGCKICQDIVHDTTNLLQQGKSLKEARTFIDGAYSKYAPPTNTPPIP